MIKLEEASGNKTDREGHNWRTARQVVRELSALEIDKPDLSVTANKGQLQLCHLILRHQTISKPPTPAHTAQLQG